jgi:hypothetical protein
LPFAAWRTAYPFVFFVNRRFPMRTITCQTRFTPGFVAVRGGNAVRVRLARDDRKHGKSPGFPISMRHPSQGSASLNPTVARLNRFLEQDADDAANRAGRSACPAGVLVRRSSASRALLESGRPRGLETQSTVASGLLPPAAKWTDDRFPAMAADSMSSDRMRYRTSTRGRGVA